MVSYLIIVGIFMTIGVLGFVYSIAMDVMDQFIPIYYSGPLSGYNNADSDYTFSFLVFAAKFILMFVLIGLVNWIFAMSQKPEQSWGGR